LTKWLQQGNIAQTTQKNYRLPCISKLQQNSMHMTQSQIGKWQQQGNITQTTQKSYTLPCAQNVSKNLKTYDPKQNWLNDHNKEI